MNTKLFLTVVVLVALLAGLYAAFGWEHSSTVKAQEQVYALHSISAVNEPAVRMWSGPIQLADGNSPDFRPHRRAFATRVIEPECMEDEQATPRRWSGCIQ